MKRQIFQSRGENCWRRGTILLHFFKKTIPPLLEEDDFDELVSWPLYYTTTQDNFDKLCQLDMVQLHIGFVCYKKGNFSPPQDLRDLNKNERVFIHL